VDPGVTTTHKGGDNTRITSRLAHAFAQAPHISLAPRAPNLSAATSRYASS
jgi:hypothetical protein